MGGLVPWSYWRLWLCERFGWTLEYVDALDYLEVCEMIDVLTSGDKALADNRRRDAKRRR